MKEIFGDNGLIIYFLLLDKEEVIAITLNFRFRDFTGYNHIEVP